MRRRESHAVMAAHGEFQSAAEREAVQGGDHGFGEPLHHPAKVGEVRRCGHRRQTEFAHVGAAAEGRSRTGEHHGADRGVALGALQGVGDALPNAQAERVDGRVIERDDGDGAA